MSWRRLAADAPADITPRAYGRTLWAVCGLGAFLILFDIWNQPPIPDDVFAGFTAVHYMESGVLGPTMWNHPCLRNILIFFTVKLFGANWLGVKASSVLMGLLCVPMMGALTLYLTRRRDAALVAAYLWAIEPLAILYSRQAINDLYLAFFPLAGLLAAARYMDSGKRPWLAFSGVLFGLGLASKWSAAVPLAFAGGALLWAIWKNRDNSFSTRLAAFALVTTALGGLAVLVYALTFLPWFGRGYDLLEWVHLHGAMATETATHKGYLPFMVGDHEPWKWFFRPVSYENFAFVPGFDEANPPALADLPKAATLLLAQGNPFVWMLVLPAMAYALIRGFRTHRAGLAFLGLLFATAYLPLVLARRPIWVNAALSVTPYAIMAVAYFATDALARLPGGRRWAWGYLALVTIIFVPLYLCTIGKGLQIHAFHPWIERYYPEHFFRR